MGDKRRDDAMSHEQEAAYLETAYRQAVGEALSLGIKTYRPGGAAKALGELRDEVRRTLDPDHDDDAAD